MTAGGLMAIFGVAYVLITAIINICFATAVHQDAVRLSYRDAVIFVGPGLWTLATLFGGVFVAVAYWVMHHSRLNAFVGNVGPSWPDDEHRAEHRE